MRRQTRPLPGTSRGQQRDHQRRRLDRRSERERRNIERDLGRKPTPRKHTKNEIKALVCQLKDIVGTLANADPEDKRAVYDELGVNLTYHQDGRVHVAAGARVLRDRVGGAIHTPSTRAPWEAWLVAAA